jgi:hypothetical protein
LRRQFDGKTAGLENHHVFPENCTFEI